mmetsp:Transcript_2862/g.5903  ORF Transcript_2862/g.5903 Transcript_2862/m.5903 type:complete len:261 (+) Transcript_2862:429-1211(+)
MLEFAMRLLVLKKFFPRYPCIPPSPLICITSPRTRCSITADINSTTSRLRSLARLTDALARRKSPPSIAILFPNCWFAVLLPRRIWPLSMTSSWKREAVWIISVMHARRRCVGRMTEEEGREEEIRNRIVGRIFFPVLLFPQKYPAASLSFVGLVSISLSISWSRLERSEATVSNGLTLLGDGFGRVWDGVLSRPQFERGSLRPHSGMLLRLVSTMPSGSARRVDEVGRVAEVTAAVAVDFIIGEAKADRVRWTVGGGMV